MLSSGFCSGHDPVKAALVLHRVPSLVTSSRWANACLYELAQMGKFMIAIGCSKRAFNIHKVYLKKKNTFFGKKI